MGEIGSLFEFLLRFKGTPVASGAGGFLVQCPTHDDSTASLHVSEKDAKILVRCFARCQTEAVVAAVGLTMRDLFLEEPTAGLEEAAAKAPRARRPRSGRKATDSPRARPVYTEYDYRDEQGRRLYQSVRVEEFDEAGVRIRKDFFRRRPDGKGGWINKLDPAGRRVVYRLPELTFAVAAGEVRVLYVEGEKDVGALGQLGIPATTHIGGAEAFRAEYIAQLVAAGVQILVCCPDHDPAGRDLMRQVFRQSRAAGLQTCWLELPGVPEKGDASDWLAAGGTRTALRGLLDALPVLDTPPQEPASAPETAPGGAGEGGGGLLHTPEGGEPSQAGPQEPPDPPEEEGEEAGEPPDYPEGGAYGVHEGALAALKPGEGGKWQSDKLCNFDAWVDEERQLDNGQEMSFAFLVQGRLATGEPLRAVLVPAERFNGMTWVTTEWGIRPSIKPGATKHTQVRAAIQYRSSPLSRLVFTHTGWRRIGDVWRYLSGDGAIGDASLQVDLGPDLRRYRLPVKPLDLKRAVRKSLQLLGLAPLMVTVPLWCAMFRAPLAEVLPVGFTMWVAGRTGVHKSSLAAVFMAHHGDFFDRTSLNLGWSSSDNFLEQVLFTLKDSVAPLDDFVAGPDQRDMQNKAARLVRAQGNRAGRGRMSADLEQRASRPPRGLLLVTAETYPIGESIFARTFTIEMESGQVRLDALTEVQRQEHLSRLPHAMAGYLAWLAPSMKNGLRKDIGVRFRETRAAVQLDGVHMRVPEIIAELLLGQHYALAYAQDIGAITEAEASEKRDEGRQALERVGQQQGAMVEERRPTHLFLEVLLGMLLERRYCLLRPHERPEEHKPPPVALGWMDETHLYLLPRTAAGEISKTCREHGTPLPIDEGRLIKELAEEGIAEIGVGRNSVDHRIGGKPRKVVRLNRVAIERVLGGPFGLPDETTGPRSSPDETSGPATADEPQPRFRGF